MNAPRFQVGQPGVLVEEFKDKGKIDKIGVEFPVRGPIYHVRELVQSNAIMGSKAGYWYLRLVEIQRPPREGVAQEDAFHDALFAPVEELPLSAIEELLRESLIKPEVFV